MNSKFLKVCNEVMKKKYYMYTSILQKKLQITNFAYAFYQLMYWYI